MCPIVNEFYNSYLMKNYCIFFPCTDESHDYLSARWCESSKLESKTIAWMQNLRLFPGHLGKKMKVKSLSHVQLLSTPWTAAYQAPLSMDFPGMSTGVGCHCLLRCSQVGTSIIDWFSNYGHRGKLLKTADLHWFSKYLNKQPKTL